MPQSRRWESETSGQGVTECGWVPESRRWESETSGQGVTDVEMCATVQAMGVKRPRDRVLQSVDGCQNPGDVSQRPRDGMLQTWRCVPQSRR